MNEMFATNWQNRKSGKIRREIEPECKSSHTAVRNTCEVMRWQKGRRVTDNSPGSHHTHPQKKMGMTLMYLIQKKQLSHEVNENKREH